MEKVDNNWCFCSLALGLRHRNLAVNLAESIKLYYPHSKIILLTDKKSHFKTKNNVIPIKYRQRGALRCYNEKRFAIKEALGISDTAIYVDADSVFVAEAELLFKSKGGMFGRVENLIEHVTRWRPERVRHYVNVANKLDIDIKNAKYIQEAFFAVKNDGKASEFIEQWGLIASYLEVKGIHDGMGAVMGLAAMKVGWPLINLDECILNSLNHMNVTDYKYEESFFGNLKRRVRYHIRNNISKLKALKNFNFYYR